MVQCSLCNFIYLNPAPSKNELMHFYPDYYWQGEKRLNREKLFPIIFSASREKKRLIYRIKKKGSLLDIGCAEGFFLAKLKQEGWDVVGVDFSAQAIASGKSMHSVPLYRGEITTLWEKIKAEHPGLFDVVTLWATLEHVYDPIKTIKSIRPLLKDEGYLIFTVPNMDSLQARFFKQHWLHLDVPRHLCFFTEDSCKQLLDKTGFILKKIEYQSYEHNPAGWVYSLLYVLRSLKQGRYTLTQGRYTLTQGRYKVSKESENKGSVQQEKQSLIKRFFYECVDVIFVPAMLPLTFLCSLMKRGGTLIVYARKKKGE